MKRIMRFLKATHLPCLAAAVSLAAVMTAGCEQEFIEQDYSTPEILNLDCSVSDEVEADSRIAWSAEIHDDATSIIRMNVELVCKDRIINSVSMKLQGRDYSFSDEPFYVPFISNFDEDSEALLIFTAMNRTGQECRDTVELTVTRPNIPETLYLHYGDNTVEMTKSALNPYEYSTPDSQFPGNMTAFISTSEKLEDSRLVWGYSASSGTAAVLENGEGDGFTLNYGNANVSNIYFNTLTFAVTTNVLEGVYINGIKLDEGASLAEADNSVYASSVYFEKGQKVTVNGIDNMSQAYNRDFFSYDSSTGELVFLRETGSWDVIYSAAYNYIWVYRADDAAPDCLWLVGHGFTSASVWNDDYNTGGWGYDYLRTGYAVKTDDNLYQATVYLTTSHEWAGFEVEIYSDRNWNKTNGALLQEGSLFGDTEGFTISKSNGFANSADGSFIPGYYRLTIDTSAGVGNETMTIEKIQ